MNEINEKVITIKFRSGVEVELPYVETVALFAMELLKDEPKMKKLREDHLEFSSNDIELAAFDAVYAVNDGTSWDGMWEMAFPKWEDLMKAGKITKQFNPSIEYDAGDWEEDDRHGDEHWKDVIRAVELKLKIN
jgi:hypothetical protein